MKNLICVSFFLLPLVLSIQSPAQNKSINCTRGQAEPIVKKSIFPNTNFQLQADSLTAFETIDFKNGDHLKIKKWGGRSYYCLTFNFETVRFQKDITDLGYWFRVSSKLMAKVLKGIEAPVDLKSGVVALNDYIRKDKRNDYRNLRTDAEIYFGVREPKECCVIVDTIQKLSARKFLIKLTFMFPF